MLVNPENYGSRLTHIELHHFSAYNKQYGWEQGNAMLKQIAQLLLQSIEHGHVFRFHGDDFIVMSKDDTLSSWEVPLNALMRETPILVHISDYTIDSHFSIHTLK